MKMGLQFMLAVAALCGAAGCSQQQQVQSAATPKIADASAVSSGGAAAPPQDIAAGTAPVQQPAVAVPAGSAGMKIYIDPATGQPRDPTPEEVAAAGRARVTEQSTVATEEPSQVRVMANGQVEVNVGKRGMHEIRVCRQADGSVSEENCPADAGQRTGKQP